MGNWKVLGEVPDSDDEFLGDDSQLSDPIAPAADDDDGHGLLDPTDSTGDVWDVPASLPPDEPHTPQSRPKLVAKSRSPLPAATLQLPLPDDEDDIDLVDDGSSQFPDTPRDAHPSQHQTTPTGRPQLSIHLPCAPLRSPLQQVPSSPLSSLSSLTGSPLPPSPSQRAGPETSRQSPSPSPSPPPVSPDSPPAFRLGFVRSLRPRKPIQQHPYMLENARYTSVMKSHGVKPVRAAYAPAPGDAAVAEEDSQEQDFMGEDSQNPNTDSAPAEDGPFAWPSSSLGYHDHDGGVARWTPSPRTSTPAQHLLQLGSRDSGEDGTDNTSLPDEDDFFSPQTLLRRHHERQQQLPVASDQDFPQGPRRKRLKTATEAKAVSRDRTPSPRWIPVRVDISPMPQPPTAVSNVDSANIFQDSDVEGQGQDEHESDSDVVQRRGRRIPASWLMLDQRIPLTQSAARPSRKPVQPDLVPRKGLALPKPSTSGTTPMPEFIFDSSDDSDGNADKDVEILGSRRKIPGGGAIWTSDEDDEPPRYRRRNDMNDIDDADSVIEEDIIDRMTSGSKRRSLTRGGSLAKRQRTSGLFKGIVGQKTRQPKITKMMESASVSKRHRSRSHLTSRSTSSSSTRQPAQRRHRAALPPPMLSILDVVEPTAPNFIRIAARTARSRPALGKTSPSRKMINLGSRRDNVDALSVLHSWKAGKIQPRISHQAAKTPKTPKTLQTHWTPRTAQTRTPSASTASTAGRQPTLHEVSPNLTRAPPASKEKSTTEAVPGTSTQKNTLHKKPVLLRQRVAPAPFRPAQLETTAMQEGRPGKSYFVSRKKQLDEMYRRRRRDAPLLPDVHLERFIDDCASVVDSDTVQFDPAVPDPLPSIQISNTEPTGPAPRSRFRKRYDPRRIDTTAPRFTHALDPIPILVDMEQSLDRDAIQQTTDDRRNNKLMGLGPFGSQYSQHFDIFPLESGLFFHRDTLFGSGYVDRALGTEDRDEDGPRREQEQVQVFQLDRRDLEWQSWDDNVSSEFGILFDWLADTLLPGQDDQGGVQTRRKATEAVLFVLDFMQRCVAAPDTAEETRQSFVLRCTDVLSSLAGRLEATALQQTRTQETKNSLAALSAVLLVAVSVLRICRDSPTCLAEAFAAEALLQKLAKLGLRILCRCGLGHVRAVYDDLQRQPHLLEQGIGGSDGDKMQVVATTTWAVLVQVLGYARLPRAGFWDLAYAAMLDGMSVATCTEAGLLERLWEDLFTLLPLGEVDSRGAVQAGLRQLVPLDGGGWTLPRQILSRVFAVYKANARQAASFNAYCRALVGRCHYLVAEWGWQRCSSIIGVIFDFYGSQDFAHLRNEEAYGSPRFLEQLASYADGAGSGEAATAEAVRAVSVLGADDKCFHVFIKMLALVILRLRRLGQTNELRNLIARTLPNHNRQYLKERDIHARDLAALRNHHDLLCTLFWAAPAGVRPGVHLLEKLVTPASAHKEACLINVRAWSQLARFVVASASSGSSSGEGYATYRSFVTWMNGSLFQQVLDQFFSVEADMQKQLANLSASMMRGIGPPMLRAMAAKNKAVAADVLQACMAAEVDVLRHARTLEMATYCFSNMPLEAVLTRMDFVAAAASLSSCEFRLLQTSLGAIEHYLERLDKAVDEQYSSMSTDEFGDADMLGGAVDAHATEEAILMLDHRLAKPFFRLHYKLTHMPLAEEEAGEGSEDGSVSAVRLCVEKCVELSARLASRFVQTGVYRLSRFFGDGGSDYTLFERLPHAAGLAQRRYLPLFVAGVVENNVFDFRDMGTSLLELWLQALVKPAHLLAYELRLVQALQRHDLPYVRKAFVPGATRSTRTATTTTTTTTTTDNGRRPNYEMNRAFFACALSSMRLSLREAASEPGGQRRSHQLRSDFAQALRLVMRQMREDLKYVRMDGQGDPNKDNKGAHERYVAFVRSIVALIKSHGGDICPVDAFFYQQSPDYGPSVEDPQLQMAGIVAYGVRLAEGEATAAPQLFHYLHNNLHIAVANDRLGQECAILERSMAADNEVLRFVLTRMLPAILQATRASRTARARAAEMGLRRMEGMVEGTLDAWPMLAVYSSALQSFLTRCDVPKDFGEANLVAMVGLLGDVLDWLRALAASVRGDEDGYEEEDEYGDEEDNEGQGRHTRVLSCVQVHVLAQLAALAAVLQPFLMTCSFLSDPISTFSSTGQVKDDETQEIKEEDDERAVGDAERAVNPVAAALDKVIREYHGFAHRAAAVLQERQANRIPTAELLSGSRTRRSILSGLVDEKVEKVEKMEEVEQGQGPGPSEQGSGGSRVGSTAAETAQVDMFCRMIVRHVRENWVVSDGQIAVRRTGARSGALSAGGRSAGGAVAVAGVSAAASSAAAGGTAYGPWAMADLLEELQRQVEAWKLVPKATDQEGGVGGRVRRLFPGRQRTSGGSEEEAGTARRARD